MKLEKINKKAVGIGIVLLLIIVVILITVLIVLSNNSNIITAKNKLNYIYSDQWNEEKFPDGMPKFYRAYEGKLTAENIGKSIYYIVNEVIPDYNNLFKDKSDDEIEKYYDENMGVVALLLGINNKNDFKNFVHKILEIDKTEIQLEEFYIDGDSIEVKTSYSTANLHIKYSESEEIIIKIKVLRNKSDEISSIQYSI